MQSACASLYEKGSSLTVETVLDMIKIRRNSEISKTLA